MRNVLVGALRVRLGDARDLNVGHRIAFHDIIASDENGPVPHDRTENRLVGNINYMSILQTVCIVDITARLGYGGGMNKDLPLEAGFYRQLGENIRQYRQRLGLSQEVLARLVGLTRTSLTNIESGRQHPPLFTFCEIAEQLKVEATELLPARKVSNETVDLQKAVGQQVRGDQELAFIANAIGMKGTSGNGSAKTKNPEHR
jgi:transcriptional regulator with XRE-family HTH domain